MYWSLLRLQKQSRLLCDRTILHSEEQLWTKTEDTEAPHLHEISHTSSSTQQRCMQLHKKLQNPSVLIITKAAKTKQTTLWSNNFAFRGAVMNYKWRYGSATHIYTKHRTPLAPHSNVICKFMKNFNTLVYWSLQRLQKQSRLLCDRTILHSEEQLWTKTEDTEAPHLHETSHTTSSTQQCYMHLQKNSYIGVLIINGAAKKNRILCDRIILHSEEQLWTITEDTEEPHLHEISHTTISTQQRCMQLHKKLRNPSVLIITKAAKTKQTTLWSNNFAFRGAVMNCKWRYGSATHIYTKHRTLLAPHSNVICKFMKNYNTLVSWSLLRLQKQSRLLCDRTNLHSEELLWKKTEGTEAPQLHETTHTTSSTQQRYIHLQKIPYIGVLIIIKAAKTKQTTLWSNNFALRGAVMNQNWRYGSTTSTQNIAHY